MKKKRYFLLSLLLLMLPISANAMQRETSFGSVTSDNAAGQYLSERATSTNEWKHKEIIGVNELLDTDGHVNGYVYTLSNGGYIITKKAIKDNYIVLQASYEGYHLIQIQ